MLFSYNKTLLSLIYQFSIGIFFLYLILCSQSPACAGKTTRLLIISSNSRDHPRVCGKNRYILCSSTKTLGSPPHVREKHVFELTFWIGTRITLACAVKTLPEQASYLHQRDHPRVCGKNYPATMDTILQVGSPPRVREKQEGIKLISAELGITPACAGKTNP